jgi:hypothetical protein
MDRNSERFGSTLWAVTCYFNPAGYRRRLANYRLFRERLVVPLLTVELSFGDEFELQHADAEILLPLRSADVLWHKERLLQLAVLALPTHCRQVVWLDCDTIFGGDTWPEAVNRALETFPLVQPFNRVYHLARDAHLLDPCDPAGAEFVQESIPLAVAAGRPARECMGGVRSRLSGSYVMGMGWAMRRELLERVGIYDACIVGGGTRAFVSAAYGCFDETLRLNLMNDRQRDHYIAWAEPFFQAVQGSAACVNANLFHLWHGDMADRGYKERYQGLQPFDFDPALDLAIAPNGAWQWNTDKPLMHQYVRDYFAGRKEDG